MVTERRKHPRVRVLLDGHWKARPVSGFYRLADLSLGGCFLQAHRFPTAGQVGTLTIYFLHDGPMVVEGEVVHVSRPVGFAVRFPHLTSSHEFQLSMQLETLRDQENVDHFPLHAYIWSTRAGVSRRTPPNSEPPAEEESHGPRTPKTPPRDGTD